MVWTVLIEKESDSTDRVKSIIFEGEHDPTSAYRSFLSRSTEFRKEHRVIAMIPGRHSYVYFPKEESHTGEENG